MEYNRHDVFIHSFANELSLLLRWTDFLLPIMDDFSLLTMNQHLFTIKWHLSTVNKQTLWSLSCKWRTSASTPMPMPMLTAPMALLYTWWFPEKLLLAAKEPGVVCTFGACDSNMNLPSLVVDGVGPVARPLIENSVVHLISNVRTASSTSNAGKGGWISLSSLQFQIKHPKWKTGIHKLTRIVCIELGVDLDKDQEVHAEWD